MLAIDEMTSALDGHTLRELREIDSLTREAQRTYLELKAKNLGIFNLPTALSLPKISNEA